ncbi:MAG: ABC transporter substrate-binding protein [Oscillospiraceae bacterium]
MHKRKDNRAVKLRTTQLQQDTADKASAESAQDEADVPETEPVTIHLFHQKQEAQDAFTQIIDAFHKEYPTINVEQEIVTNEPAAILKARLATNEIPDIFQGSTNTMDIAQGGYIMDLAGEAFLNNVTDEARLDSTFSDSEGHTWALPIDGSCEGIFYNKDIFAEYDIAVPTTVTEFKAAVETLKANGVTPFALGFKDSWTIKPVSLIAAASAVYGKDIHWDDARSAGTESFAACSGWSTTFELMKYIYENGNTQTAFDTDYNTACAMIANGEAAMMVQGLWALEPIKEINPSINLGMMALPVSDDPSETKLFQFPDFGLSISASTKYPEACKLFLEFLTRPEIAELWCSTSKLFSAVKGVSVDFDPLAKDVEAYIDAGMVCTQVDRGWPTAFGPEYESALSSYLLDQDSLEHILAGLDASWDNALAASQAN